VFAHYVLDRLSRFIRIVKWNCADIVMKNMSLDDPVEEIATNEAKFTIDGGSCAPREVPSLWFVMGQTRIGVLEIGNRD